MTLDDDSMINEDNFNNFFVNIGESLISKFKQTDTNNINVKRPANSFNFKNNNSS